MGLPFPPPRRYSDHFMHIYLLKYAKYSFLFLFIYLFISTILPTQSLSFHIILIIFHFHPHTGISFQESKPTLQHSPSNRNFETKTNMGQDVGDHVVPSEMAQSKLKACMSCSLIKTTQQFAQDGCDNCPFMSYLNDRERIGACTTSQFVGYVSTLFFPFKPLSFTS